MKKLIIRLFALVTLSTAISTYIQAEQPNLVTFANSISSLHNDVLNSIKFTQNSLNQFTILLQTLQKDFKAFQSSTSLVLADPINALNEILHVGAANVNLNTIDVRQIPAMFNTSAQQAFEQTQSQIEGIQHKVDGIMTQIKNI